MADKKTKWSTDLFVHNDALTWILEEEKIEGTDKFEEKTGMSRETLWHIKNGKSRYTPFDKADHILTRMGAVHRVNDLAVYTRDRDGDGNFRYNRE